MIDARSARAEPDEYRRRLTRKGAAEAFDAWLAADQRWRDLDPVVDELRSRTSTGGSIGAWPCFTAVSSANR